MSDVISVYKVRWNSGAINFPLKFAFTRWLTRTHFVIVNLSDYVYITTVPIFVILYILKVSEKKHKNSNIKWVEMYTRKKDDNDDNYDDGCDDNCCIILILLGTHPSEPSEG